MFRNEGQNVDNIYKHNRKIRKIISNFLPANAQKWMLHMEAGGPQEEKPKPCSSSARAEQGPVIHSSQEKMICWQLHGAEPSDQERSRGRAGGSHSSLAISSSPCSAFLAPPCTEGTKHQAVFLPFPYLHLILYKNELMEVQAHCQCLDFLLESF